MNRVALLLILTASFVHAQPADRGQGQTATPAGDLLITVEFNRSMTGNVPPQMSDAARMNESILVIKVKGARVALTSKPLHPTVPFDFTFVSDTASGEIVTIDHARKEYTRDKEGPPAEELAAIRKGYEKLNGPQPKERPIAKPTGKTAEISGYPVEEYVAETPKARYTYWVAPSLKKYVHVVATTLTACDGPVGALAMMWQPDPAKFPGVPIRTILEYRRDGYTVVSTTTTLSFREVKLSDEDFAIPSGYKEVAIGSHEPK
jgi:hypothetical protein